MIYLFLLRTHCPNDPKYWVCALNNQDSKREGFLTKKNLCIHFKQCRKYPWLAICRYTVEPNLRKDGSQQQQEGIWRNAPFEEKNMKMETSLSIIRESALIREKINIFDLKYKTSVIQMGSADNWDVKKVEFITQ